MYDNTGESRMEEKKQIEKVLKRINVSLERAVEAKKTVDDSDVDDDAKGMLYTVTEKALSYSLDVCFGSDEEFDAVHTYNSWIEMELENLW